MKYIKILNVLPVLGSLTIFLSACDKIATTEPLGDAGQTIVKVNGGGTTSTPGYKLLNIDLKATPQILALVDVRRDVPSNAELNRTMNVIVRDEPGAVRAFDTLLVPLPIGSYSFDPSTPHIGNEFKLTFAPGEFAKEIKLNLPNALSLSLSSRYAFGFTLTSVDADGKILGDQKTIVVEIGVKNPYDGIYTYASGLVTRYTAPGMPANDALSGTLSSVNPNVSMATVGAYTVEVTGLSWHFDPATATPLGVGGIDGLKLTVDPATNLVKVTSTGYVGSNATLTNWAGHVNKYDPATRTFTLAFRWNPATTTREMEVVWKYKGPR